MSLAGKQIVVTRAPHQAQELGDVLRKRGATPVLYPCIDIAPPDDVAPLDAALRNLSAYEWLILTSINTVHALQQRVTVLELDINFAAIKVAAVGPKTAQAAQDLLSVEVAEMPEDYKAESLAGVLAVRELTEVLLPQSSRARDTLANILESAGANVTQVVAYENVMGKGCDNVSALLERGAIDALTFTSSSTVENFLKRVEPHDPTALPAACIGPVTADTARDCGFQQVIVPQNYTLEQMVAALADAMN